MVLSSSRVFSHVPMMVQRDTTRLKQRSYPASDQVDEISSKHVWKSEPTRDAFYLSREDQ